MQFSCRLLNPVYTISSNDHLFVFLFMYQELICKVWIIKLTLFPVTLEPTILHLINFLTLGNWISLLVFEGTTKNHLSAVTKIPPIVHLLTSFRIAPSLQVVNQKFKLYITPWHTPSSNYISALPHTTCKHLLVGEEQQNSNNNGTAHQKVDLSSVRVQSRLKKQISFDCDREGEKEEKFYRLIS